MNVSILWDEAVSPDLAAHNDSVMCSYPFGAAADNGRVWCLYRRGREKHSPDGVLVLQQSTDNGRTWPSETVVFDGRDRQPPWIAVTGTLCRTVAGSLVSTVGIVEVTRPDVYLFSEEGVTQRRRVCILREAEHGAHRGEPIDITPDGSATFGITTSPLPLPDGRLMIPLEVHPKSHPIQTQAVFSEDDGRTVGKPVVCARDDAAGNKNLCDARCTVLHDGTILMLLWTFLTGNEETIEVHAVRSPDGGRTWTQPRPTGMQGQIAVPLELPDGRLIAAVNYRHPPDGIRLYMSRDGGMSWDKEPPVQLWDVRESRVLGRPVDNVTPTTEDEGVWDELPKFTFGTPGLLLLEDDTILLTYYATRNDICHVRACGFRIR